MLPNNNELNPTIVKICNNKFSTKILKELIIDKNLIKNIYKLNLFKVNNNNVIKRGKPSKISKIHI
jgi:hypothetical protein